MAGAHDHQGGFAVPNDITGYVEQPFAFATGTNTWARGTGTPPGVTNMLAPIEVSEAGFLHVPGGGSGTPQPTAPPASEAKFRLTIAAATHVLADDPIRNFGHPGASHGHMFFGNKATNAHSTFASLRTRNDSNSVGGPMNATAYWMPWIEVPNAFGDGKKYACRSQNTIIYYSDTDIANTTRLVRIPAGLRYIIGMNMDDPLESRLRTAMATANATNPGRYKLSQSSGDDDRIPANMPPRRFLGWKMLAPNGSTILTSATADRPNSQYSDGFKNLDGTDPWLGAADPANNGGQKCTISAVFDGSAFWDGVNLWSPGGYNHVSYGLWDTLNNKFVGPEGWYEVPKLQGQIIFYHNGWTDYQRWALSSDPMVATALGRAIPPGYSWHTDWFGAWQDRVLLGWQNYCIGIDGGPHQCDAGAFADAEALNALPADPPSYDTSSPEGMFLIPTTGTGKGPLVMKAKTG